MKMLTLQPKSLTVDALLRLKNEGKIKIWELQREPDQKYIQSIKDGLLRLFKIGIKPPIQPLYANLKDGVFELLDGQHRLAAFSSFNPTETADWAKVKDLKVILMYAPNMTLEQQMAIYGMINTILPVQNIDFDTATGNDKEGLLTKTFKALRKYWVLNGRTVFPNPDLDKAYNFLKENQEILTEAFSKNVFSDRNATEGKGSLFQAIFEINIHISELLNSGKPCYETIEHLNNLVGRRTSRKKEQLITAVGKISKGKNCYLGLIEDAEWPRLLTKFEKV
jgi:hypothetical protein